MGAEWKEMDKDDKEPFEALAEKDKARYEREMANYTTPTRTTRRPRRRCTTSGL